MKIFQTFAQLRAARILNDTPVKVLEPTEINGVVVPSGDGLILASGNVFQPRFSDLESLSGRHTFLLEDEFDGLLNATLNTFSQDNDGAWVDAIAGKSPNIFYAGRLWWIDEEMTYDPVGAKVLSWRLDTDLSLEVSTDRKGNIYFSPTSQNFDTDNLHVSGGLQVDGNTNIAGDLQVSGGSILSGGLGVVSDGEVNGITIGKGSGNVTYNTVFGRGALENNTSGNYNIALGPFALRDNTTGAYNMAFGYRALLENTTGEANVSIGYSSMDNNTTGRRNVAVGHNAMSDNEDGQYNVAIGYNALLRNVTDDCNTAIGYLALQDSNGGIHNTAVGYAVAQNITTADYSSILGSYAGEKITTGSRNTLMGYRAGYTLTSGSGNVMLGYQAGYNETGSNKLHIANRSDKSLITGDFSADVVKVNGSLEVTTTSLLSDTVTIRPDNETVTALSIGGTNAWGSKDIAIRIGSDNNQLSWLLHYNGTTSGTDGNEFQIVAPDKSGGGWQIDHLGNMHQTPNGGTTWNKIYHAGDKQPWKVIAGAGLTGGGESNDSLTLNIATGDAISTAGDKVDLSITGIGRHLTSVPPNTVLIGEDTNGLFKINSGDLVNPTADDSRRGPVTLVDGGSTGTANDRDAGTITLSAGTIPYSGAANSVYYVVDNEATSTITGTSEDFNPGNFLVWNGTKWIKTAAGVDSWQGRTGDINVALGDLSSDVIHYGSNQSRSITAEVGAKFNRSGGSITGNVNMSSNTAQLTIGSGTGAASIRFGTASNSDIQVGTHTGGSSLYIESFANSDVNSYNARFDDTVTNFAKPIIMRNQQLSFYDSASTDWNIANGGDSLRLRKGTTSRLILYPDSINVNGYPIVNGTNVSSGDVEQVISWGGTTIALGKLAGNGVYLGADAATVIGSGEATKSILNNESVGTAEILHMGSDSHIYMYVNGQTWGDRIRHSFSSDGNSTFGGRVTGTSLAVEGGITMSRGTSAGVASVFSGDTTKNWISFPAASSSNDPGYIMHETSTVSADSNKGVLHLCPSDDADSSNDYVVIKGTNDPENIRLYTAGNAYFAGSITLNGINGSNYRIYDAAGANAGNDAIFLADQGSHHQRLRLQDGDDSNREGLFVETSTNSGTDWTTRFSAEGRGAKTYGTTISTAGGDFYSHNGAFISNDSDGEFGDRAGDNIDHFWHRDTNSTPVSGYTGSWIFVSDGDYKQANGDSILDAGGITLHGPAATAQSTAGVSMLYDPASETLNFIFN